MKPQPGHHNGDIQPRPPSGELPPRRRRSGDVRTRSGDVRTRSDDVRTRSGDPHTRHKGKSETQDDNIRTRSGGARVRSHDQAIVCNAKKQPESPLTSSTPSIEQQVTSRSDSSEIPSHLTSQSDSRISPSNCNDQATPAVAAVTPPKFNWEKQVTPVLNAINSASKSDTEALCELCTNLWTALQLSNIIGRSTGKSKQRSSVLRAMFQLLDSKESRLLLRATKIILAVSLALCVVELCNNLDN